VAHLRSAAWRRPRLPAVAAACEACGASEAARPHPQSSPAQEAVRRTGWWGQGQGQALQLCPAPLPPTLGAPVGRHQLQWLHLGCGRNTNLLPGCWKGSTWAPGGLRSIGLEPSGAEDPPVLPVPPVPSGPAAGTSAARAAATPTTPAAGSGPGASGCPAAPAAAATAAPPSAAPAIGG
jgi:hypothetical protein